MLRKQPGVRIPPSPKTIMSYQVIARKWRPQSFDEVVFQDHVSKTLKNSVRNGRISHAYIFSGPRGVGKTTMARILAKSLNCIEGPTEEPCGVCENCTEIKSGSAFDVIEIDGASNRGIDDIRELRENVNFAPVKGRYKIYIIDEVHMLTKEAFNALLKTLEEPPAHAIFIFATTEVHQIPDTILSRCQKFFFKKIPVGPVVDHLKSIVDREGYRISESALYPIARAGGGSMRDAQSLLDQVISFSDFREAGDDSIDIEIQEEDALAILGIVPVESYMKLLFCVISADPAAAMNEIDRVVSMGVDIPRYVSGLNDTIRTLRLIKNSVSVKEILNLSDDEISVLKEAADGFHDDELSIIFRLAVELQTELRFSNTERVNLEMAILDMISVKKTPSISEIINKIQTGGITMPSAGTPSDEKKNSIPQNKPVTPSARQEPASRGQSPSAPVESDLKKAWEAFMQDAAAKKSSLHIILKPAVIETEGNSIIISYPPSDEFVYYRRTLDRQKLDTISAEMERRTGREIAVSLEDKPSSAPPTAPQNTGPEQETSADNVNAQEEDIPPPEDEMVKNPEDYEFEQTNPAVEKIINTFHGQIIERKGE